MLFFLSSSLPRLVQTYSLAIDLASVCFSCWVRGLHVALLKGSRLWGRAQELIINRDVTCENGLWEKPMSHLEYAVLEMVLLIMC